MAKPAAARADARALTITSPVTRRSILAGAAALVAPLAAAGLAAPRRNIHDEYTFAPAPAPDPILLLVAAYRDEFDQLNALPAGLLEDAPMPAWDALSGDALPPATSYAGAVAALRLVMDLFDEIGADEALPNLTRAALDWLESHPFGAEA